MRKNRISEFLESIDGKKWNCVYQANDMTLLTSKEYNYRCEEIVNLKIQLKKQKEIIDDVKNWIYKVQNNKDNKHLEPIISTDELDELLNILNEVLE
jgi:hypothetical protein